MAFDGAIGIDLGTTNSCVAVWCNDRVEVIPNFNGNRTTPSVVAFTNERMLVGDDAKRQVATNPSNTLFQAKRLIGRNFSDPIVQSDMSLWPFKVTNNGSDQPRIAVESRGSTKYLAPEEISAIMLKRLKADAEAYLDKTVTDAVVTVPAYFNAAQREATINAGKIAGLNVLRILSEPTAAAMAYGIGHKNCNNRSKIVLVFDFGGGTLDVSLMRVEDDVFEVIATSGDTHLGGEDFDLLLKKHCVDEFTKKHTGKAVTAPRAIQRLRIACEGAKHKLSSAAAAEIVIDSLVDGIDFQTTITRDCFENMCDGLIRKALTSIDRVLEDAKMNKRVVDDVVLVGGSTRIPKVQQLVSEYFDGKALNKSINADEAIAYGAAVMAFVMAGGESKLTDALLLLDVTPLTLGVDSKGGVMSALIKRNTTIPVQTTKVFITSVDNQTAVRFSVIEGERAMAADCHTLGTFTLDGVTAAPAGIAKFDVTFEMDPNGILNVSAVDKQTGKKRFIVITKDKCLSKVEIEVMIRNAATYAQEDGIKRDRIVARNDLEMYSYSMRNNAANPQVGGLLAEADKSTLKSAIDEALAWVLANKETASTDEFVRRKRELVQVCNTIMSTTYQNSAASSHQQAAHHAGPKVEDVD